MLVYQTTGSGFPLVLLHPFPVHHGFWTPIRDQARGSLQTNLARPTRPRSFRSGNGNGDDGRLELVVIPKAGHYAAMEQPQEFGRALRQFLDGLRLGIS